MLLFQSAFCEIFCKCFSKTGPLELNRNQYGLYLSSMFGSRRNTETAENFLPPILKGNKMGRVCSIVFTMLGTESERKSQKAETNLFGSNLFALLTLHLKI